MRFFILSLVALLGIGTALAEAESRPAVKLSKMFPMLEAYLELPEGERSHFEIQYVVKAEDPSLTDFELWIEPDGGRVDIERSPDGTVKTEGLGPYLQSDPMVMTTLPKGGGAINMTPAPIITLSEEIPMSEVSEAVEQANSAIRKRAGMLSFAAPSFKSVRFLVPPGATASLRLEDGTLETLEADDDWVEVRPKRKLSGATVIFSEAPEEDVFSD